MCMSESEINIAARNEIEWRKLMLRKLDKLEDSHNDFKLSQTKRITVLEVKSGIVGSIAGLISGGIVSAVVAYWLKS